MKKGLLWFRRDLRLHDHAALNACVKENDQTYFVFVFDKNILDPLKKKSDFDFRVQFICESLVELVNELKDLSAGVHILYGEPTELIPELAKELQVNTVYFNRDYSSYPRLRDEKVTEELSEIGIQAKTYQDHVLVEPNDLLKQDKTPYKVFTPYANAWKNAVFSSEKKVHESINFSKIKNDFRSRYHSLEAIQAFAGFRIVTTMLKGGTTEAKKRLSNFKEHLDQYHNNRDYPYLDRTSKLSVYIRHGNISIQDLFAVATSSDSAGAQCWLNELIWREFYQMIAFHYPDVKTEDFNPKYKNFPYSGSENYLMAWKNGQTGFPIIDAAMRCLNQTGWMHNRLRMVTASFLTKLLLVDWRRGERYFSWKLLDYEFASNNGGWQWSSGTGCDAAPYYRIFNPYTQSKNFDPSGDFIKQYCPELRHLYSKDIHMPGIQKNYPVPIVDYKQARENSLRLYQNFMRLKE
jgi:deoxyribodipyrimidine photo-lyase